MRLRGRGCSAYRLTGAANAVSVSTLYRWRAAEARGGLGRMVRSDDGSERADCPADLWAMIVSDYMRPEQPSASECYRRALPLARRRGQALPSLPTIRRRLRNLPAGARLARRGGGGDMGPFINRSVDDLEPLDLVGADALTLDVMCDWRGDGRGRHVKLHAWQDHKSRAILGHALMETECVEGCRRSFGAMCSDHGAPLQVQIDNGRALCAVSLTGESANIHRRRVSTDMASLRGSWGLRAWCSYRRAPGG